MKNGAMVGMGSYGFFGGLKVNIFGHDGLFHFFHFLSLYYRIFSP